MKEQHSKKWAEYLECRQVTNNQHDMNTFFA